jgi:YHS domain-containing protein
VKKRARPVLLVPALLALLWGCAGTQEEAAAPQSKNSVTVVCPVSGDTLGAPREALSSVYKGQTYYFCCENCKKDFDENPEKYLPKE